MKLARRRSDLRATALVLGTLALASSVSSAAFANGLTPQTRQLSSTLARSLEPRSVASASIASISKRHGDREDDEEQEEEETGTTAHHEPAHEAAHHHDDAHMHAPASESSPHEHSHEHGHDHDHEHMQPDGPSPESVPDASTAGPELRTLPVWHSHGGHGHSHGSGPVKENLNETLLFRSKGPDPLSYIEWDFGYGMGSETQLRRFIADADVLAGTEKMGVVEGRWRKLFDESETEQRAAIANDVAARLPAKQGEPSRHRAMLVLHVVTAVLSCFVLLPMALALRAAHSNLAPLVSLLYLALLGGSMLLSIVYKALTPRLYPDNSHGSMGWAIFWISLVTLGSDVLRLVAQIWSVISALRSNRGGENTDWLPTATTANGNAAPKSWRDVVSIMLGRGQVHNSEAYDALEEEAMLSEEAQSDANELDVEKNLQHRLPTRSLLGSTRHGSGSGSPHRVHFSDESSQGTRGGSAESLVSPVGWDGSGTTVASNSGECRRSLDNVMAGRIVASPTTTACNTPRTSFVGSGSPAMNLKSIPIWREATHQGQRLSAADASMSPARLRSGRLDTFRTIVRYTSVVAARSLPVLAFATSYTGLAVYTGSCRGGYKNVCLAHGIKGGIFFWFGLLTFGRYLGAYADCGWAWNKRPSPQISRGKAVMASWRRNMPSAEFVECLVIFIYGASNTWMERFGAQPGDPYTIKQIQHISIAVMFWFAGLMGMLLETKFIRNMLSFPVAYHHVAAVPLHEARRRHRQSQGRRGAEAGIHESESDLDLLVEAQTQPASYSASFNPFPALVIGVTGVAMAAHHQDYVYEVQIHMLWGQLLAGFALLRCLTYFLLWLRPPTASVLPSRPPTEALAAFSLCCGGLVFMLSSEEVSFAAMRSGYGDFMAILNVAVAVVALLFCWTTALMMLKGWAVRREVKRSMHADSATFGLGNASATTTGNALHLDVCGGAERQPRRKRASVASSTVAGATAVQEVEPVFVLDDEDDGDDEEEEEERMVGANTNTTTNPSNAVTAAPFCHKSSHTHVSL